MDSNPTRCSSFSLWKGDCLVCALLLTIGALIMRLSNSVSKINSKKQFYCCVTYFSQEPALSGLVGDRWIHSLCPRLSVEATSTGTYGHHLLGKRPYTTTREPGNKHDHYAVGVFVDETGLLSIGNSDTFLLRDV